MIETFGQPLPSTSRLSPLARAISSRVGDGRPSPWAGFLWRRPHTTPGQALDQDIREHLREPRRAA
jgi:hypothetical protein